ncbi:PH domain-containing protein [Natronosalvus halobius]|uniref:PH domain-containing protein n=1 Tax=Natronosalvus halobius TaxID=2953746 RepID=UPI00209E102F|nr:PH domain-containing protein [Natronosalvus halobius]USZ73539.1 PH domain-containing protein [Natronosalvus halobius]
MSEPFPWLSLDTDEEVVWSGRPRLHVVGWLAVPALAIPALLVVVWPSLLSAVVGVLAWAVISYLGYVYVTNIDYVISTKYVYTKFGILGRSVTQIGLHNIQDTTLSQGIFGTHSNYGTISFSTAGGEGATLSFYLVDEPSTVKSTIDRQITRARKGTKDREEHSNERNLDDLLTELRATRKAAQRIDQLFEHGGNRP